MGRVGVGPCLSVSVCLLVSGCGALAMRDVHGPQPLGQANRCSSCLAAFTRSRGIALAVLPATRFVGALPDRAPDVSDLAVSVDEISGGSQGTNFTPETSKPLAWSTEQWCSPSASMWTIVFGVLVDPNDGACPTPRIAAIGYGPPRSLGASRSPVWPPIWRSQSGPIRMLVRTDGWHSDARRTRTVPKGTLPAGYGDDDVA